MGTYSCMTYAIRSWWGVPKKEDEIREVLLILECRQKGWGPKNTKKIVDVICVCSLLGSNVHQEKAAASFLACLRKADGLNLAPSHIMQCKYHSKYQTNKSTPIITNHNLVTLKYYPCYASWHFVLWAAVTKLSMFRLFPLMFLLWPYAVRATHPTLIIVLPSVGIKWPT